VIAIVDYGLGNVASVRNMILKAGADARITSDPHVIRQAERLILPGVGAFDHGMRSLLDRDLTAPLNHAVGERRVPVLGICLGLQLMACGSDEGTMPGLSWLSAHVVRFDVDTTRLRVPHMGWNTVTAAHPSFLSHGLPERARFYFVHSYHLRCDERADVALTTTYGGEIVAAVVKGNIAGTQFHPEKSHSYGLALMRAFLDWQP